MLFALLAVNTRADNGLNTGKIEDCIEASEPQLPLVGILINDKIGDATICKNNVGQYFITGNTSDLKNKENGIKIWKSSDLKTWTPINNGNCIWTTGLDGEPWHKKSGSSEKSTSGKTISSSKIFFYKHNYWITYTIENEGSGLLQSISGEPNGPYKEVKTSGLMVKGSNASLVEDADGALWYVWGKGEAQKLNESLTDLQPGTYTKLKIPSGNALSGNFNISLIENRLVITTAVWNSNTAAGGKSFANIEKQPDARHDAVFMSAPSINSNFSSARLLIPHGGCCQMFVDFEGHICSLVSGDVDASSPFGGKPSIVRMNRAGDNFAPEVPFSTMPNVNTKTIYVSKDGDNSEGSSWQSAYSSIQRAVDEAKENTQIWIAKGTYDATLKIALKNGVYLFGGFAGNEKSISERNIEANKTRILGGKKGTYNAIIISTCSFVRIDGLTVTGGSATGSEFTNKCGGGVNILGGGETVRIVNCTFDNNLADVDGGAVYASLGAAPLLINCIFKNNTAKNNGGAVAIYANGANGYHPQLYGCIIDNNFAVQSGGAIYFDTNQVGAGLLSLINCTISRNHTSGRYGNITLDRNARLHMNYCTVAGNVAGSNCTSVGRLGRIPATHIIENSVFSKNEGGEIFNIEGDVWLNYNKSFETNPWTLLKNCSFDNDSSAITILRRNFDGKPWKSVTEVNSSAMGSRNRAATPSFVDSSSGNYNQTATSSTIDIGYKKDNLQPFKQ